MNLGSDADQLQRRNRELANLNTIARALNQSVELEETLQTTLAQVAEVLGLKTGWIFLLDEKSGETYLAASLNLPPALVRNPQRMEGRCYCLDVYLDGDMKAAANVNVITCTRLSKLVDGTDGLRYHASIPLYAHGRQLGMLNVASPDWQEITDEDLRLLYTVGDMLGIAIERTRLYEQSVEMGTISERNRLAREIHDTLAQGLAALRENRSELSQRIFALGGLSGLLFLGLKGFEYGQKYSAGFDLAYNDFFTMYWLITGFHFLHVLVGTVLLGHTVRSISRGRYSSAEHDDVETIGVFWHMCDLIWILVFPALYILPLGGAQ